MMMVNDDDNSWIVCTERSGPKEALVGMEDSKICSFGAVVRVCSNIGHWTMVQNDCACAAEDIWEQAALGTTQELRCGNNGVLRRTCMDSGFWAAVQNFNCSMY